MQYTKIALAAVFAASACLAGDAVAVREEVMSFRERKDGWSGAWGASFAYTNGEARLSFEKTGGQLVPPRGFPGPRRMKGAVRYVLRTDGGLAGEATMCLRREARDHGTNVLVRAKAGLAKEADFTFDLDPQGAYYLNDISFRLKTPGQSVRLYGIDAVTRETAAEALRVDVETGNPLHIVRDGKDEKAMLVLRNVSDSLFEGEVHLKVEDYFGNCREGGFPVKLASGGELRRPMRESFPRGIRYVTLVASAAGTVATNRTTWAYIDTHEVTPLQPKGEFRLGFNFHGLRMSSGDSALGMDALVALGAKMVRGDALQFAGVRPSADGWDWKSSDDYLAALAEHGLALDAIVWWPAGWAQMKGADGEKLFALRTDALREYGVELAKRYGDRVAYYEVGNEWDMSNPKTFPLDVAVGQVRAFAEGMKSVCPSAKVIPCGFAAESSVRHPSNVIRPMFHENLVRDLQDVVDAHAVHLHAPAKEYSLKVRSFLEWRERMGIRIPWYANETALSSAGMRPTDRAMGVAMWQKILFSMSRGSVDYIWYNLRATGWDPADSEQGYGVFSADWHPRTGAAAFSALASTFRHQAADGVLFDGPSRQVLRFRNAQGGRGFVIAGWDDYAEKPMRIRVKTDAKAAFQVDTMGNRRAVLVADGVAVWEISANPSALRLEDASFAKPVEVDAADVAKRPVKVIVPGESMKDRNEADILLKEYEQVYEVFKAMPEHADRTWRWWGDLWVWVNTAFADGKLRFKITCWDDVHCPVPNDPLTGDCAVLHLGGWKLALVTTDKPFVKVLEGPKGVTELPLGSWKLTRQIGYHKVYDFEVDPKSLGLGNEIPFNVRVYDNDGKGFDGWMEYSPLGEEPQTLIRLSR